MKFLIEQRSKGHKAIKKGKHLDIMKAIIFSVLVCFAFVSCDPVRLIEMKNNGNDTASFVWTAIEDSIGYNPFVISNSKELRLNVPPKKEIKMSFGIGSWSPAQVQQLIKRLKSFEIISSTQNIRIDSLPMLKDFLLARRKGVGGSVIQISVSP